MPRTRKDPFVPPAAQPPVVLTAPPRRRGRQAPAAAAQPAIAVPADVPDFAVDWSKFRTPDLVLMQRFAAVEKMSEAERAALVLATAPMLDRMIVGGIPDLPMERFGDLVVAFFAKVQERGNPKA